MQKYKKTSDYSYSLGTELTLELLKNKPEKVRSVYIHSKQKDNEIYRQIVNICEKEKIEIIRSDKAFNIVNAKENCYIMALFDKFTNDIKSDTNHVVLVNPSNMGNLGTIIRTMVGFGIYDLAIITPAVDIFDPKVVRASMRAFFSLRFSYFNSFEEYENKVSSRTIYPFMLDGITRLQDTKKAYPYSLVFGNEATGLPSDFHKYENTVVIEQLNTIDSLNLDNAVSIGLYEFTKDNI